ncbi:MAG: NAD(P)-binding domain-containing protein, partial [Deltaproteobacteria bacterium]|nr:NAD(P)-binding domain-containing protein [Deltaproteobacteria bacterium]
MNFKGKKAGFIGAGNMTNALIRGITESGLFAPGLIRVSDSDPEKIKVASDLYQVAGMLSNSALCSECDLIILAVKPQVMHKV